MNKKQRNRKLVTQNRRNKLVNRRYTSTIKTFSKLITKKIKVLKEETKNEEQLKLKNETDK
jgi:ribosomal protein S20